jgi:hypothetical protein
MQFVSGSVEELPVETVARDGNFASSCIKHLCLYVELQKPRLRRGSVKAHVIVYRQLPYYCDPQGFVQETG